MHDRWTSIQASFVDEPREAVRQADTLVAEAIQRLAETFAREKANLEEQWGRGDDISTEDLRQALRRYRSFFDRLLSV
jgi:inorganic triphosphatase YgiF